MNEKDIETILAQHGGLRVSIKKLELLSKSCDKRTITQILDAKTELEILSKTKTIEFKDWDVVNKKIRDLGNKFTNVCVCKTNPSVT